MTVFLLLAAVVQADATDYFAKAIRSSGYVSEDEVGDVADDLAQQVVEYRKSRIEFLNENIAYRIKEVKTNRDVSAKDKRKRGEELKDLRSELKRLERTKDPARLPVPLLTKFDVGTIGTTMVDGFHKGDTGQSKFTIHAIVRKIVGPDDMIVDLHSCELWVTGLSTDNMREKYPILLPYVFKVTENKTFRTTVGGTRTLKVVTPIADLSKLKPPKRTGND